MSYEANAHDAQMMILRKLLLSSSSNYASLQKATNLTSDHFNFHIKKLVDADYVIKTNDGKYTLTRMGKEYANRMDTDDNSIEKQPKLSVALIIQKGDTFLAQERLKQPYYGFWGRPTGKIRWGETMLQAASRELLEETGLTADLVVGGFYHKMDYDELSGELLEDKLFVLIHGTNPKGTLIVDGEGHHNEWLTNEQFAQKETAFQSVSTITALAVGKEIGYIEQRYEYKPSEY